MASTDSTERFRPPGWDCRYSPAHPTNVRHENDYEAAAVAATAARIQARRARRRAAWGMHPALAYLTITVVAVLLVAVALLTVELAGRIPPDPDVVTTGSVPATTTTGTTTP